MAKRPRIDWVAARERYVTGTETYRDLAERLGVARPTIEQAAKPSRNDGKSWAERRQEFRDRCAGKAAEIATKTYAQKLREVGETAADVAKLALEKLQKRLAADDVRDADLIAAAKLATTMKLEVSGPDGGPVSIEVDDITKLTDEELKALVASE